MNFDAATQNALPFPHDLQIAESSKTLQVASTQRGKTIVAKNPAKKGKSRLYFGSSSQKSEKIEIYNKTVG